MRLQSGRSSALSADLCSSPAPCAAFLKPAAQASPCLCWLLRPVPSTLSTRGGLTLPRHAGSPYSDRPPANQTREAEKRGLEVLNLGVSAQAIFSLRGLKLGLVPYFAANRGPNIRGVCVAGQSCLHAYLQ
ncbi:hypothetical protein GQ53DRAFT_751211 [Thozetella sp. PMI_491]|nr:hypothetical protein GQ53DRAFT_751211 [Thozetella sp. PMI_491]